MRRRAQRSWWAPGLLVLGLLNACAADDTEPAPTASGPDAMTIAGDAARASGATFLGGVGGDGQEESSVSLSTLPWGGTVDAFIACTGGSRIGLDLAGAEQLLDCDGQARQIDSLVLPHDRKPNFKPTQLSDVPSSWGAALVEAQPEPAAPASGTTPATS